MEPKPHWLNKSTIAASLGITVQAFDKWKVDPIARIGRENFYDVRSILDNRLRLAEQKAAADEQQDGIDPLIEYKLMEERRGLTAAQRVGQENKNAVSSRQLVPVDFAVFAFSRIAAQLASILDTVVPRVVRRHPDIEILHIEAMQREIAQARNVAADLSESLPAILDEYLDQLEEAL